uniref:NTR domain-containing protein n=1 Tax=Angiostrongylus cantonensis TaxID=6313 RepID=A0A0K0CVX5_ANGCA
MRLLCVVSRVKVLFFHNPNNGNSEEVYSTYGIEHIEVYKKPFDLTALPPFILTPSNMLHCAVHLEVGREYLLSGRRGNDNKFYLFLCGHLTDEDVAGVAEWQNVSVELRSNLTTFYC